MDFLGEGKNDAWSSSIPPLPSLLTFTAERAPALLPAITELQALVIRGWQWQCDCFGVIFKVWACEVPLFWNLQQGSSCPYINPVTPGGTALSSLFLLKLRGQCLKCMICSTITNIVNTSEILLGNVIANMLEASLKKICMEAKWQVLIMCSYKI